MPSVLGQADASRIGKTPVVDLTDLLSPQAQASGIRLFGKELEGKTTAPGRQLEMGRRTRHRAWPWLC